MGITPRVARRTEWIFLMSDLEFDAFSQRFCHLFHMPSG